jgi:sterol desaturase/sphingolipid hydroxylase (fatty acid hydroxylase superfamily)
MVEALDTLIKPLYTMPLEGAALWVLLENALIFTAALVIGHFAVKIFKTHAITAPPPPITTTEVILAISCVILNSLVTWIGVVLWRAGIVQLRPVDGMIGVIVDCVVLFFAMDFAMYVFHRVAHHPLLYPLIHDTHHRFDNPRPLTLFVLNPFETLGFGALWLVVIVIYPSTFIGMIVYLTLNVAFGLIGHLGVEPYPRRWLELPLLRLVSTSTFHAEHHQDRHHNFGFYTVLWDRLFGTLSPDYTREFQSAASGRQGF